MKSLSLTVFVVALSVVLGACSSNSEETKPTMAQPEQPKAAAPEPAAPASAAKRDDSRPAESKRAEARPADNAPAKVAAPTKMVEVPEGTEVSVLLIDSISSATNKPGDPFMASLAEPIVVNGETVVSRGTKVQGRVVDAEGSGRVKGKASVRLVLTSIVAGAKTYPIVTKPFVAEAESSKGRDAGLIGGAAGVGAAIGAIAGGKSGAAKGAIIGGAAGTGGVLATKGKEVELGSEQKLKFTLEKSVDLPKIASKIS